MRTISLGTNRFHSAVRTSGQHAFGHVSDWVDIECQLEANDKNPLGPILTTPTFTLSHSLGPILLLDYQPTSKCLLYRVAFSSFDTNISDR